MTLLKTNSFVELGSVYNSQSERNLLFLGNVYNDLSFLINAIENITRNHLNKSEVSGKRILIKPNWVVHSSSSNDDLCLRTNDSFLLAFLNVILKQNPAQVIIGDSPIQSCNWTKVVSREFCESIQSLSNKYTIPIKIVDFRRRIYNPGKIQNELKPIEDYLIFDLGPDSFLEPITTNSSQFRVTNYNPERMNSSHSPGVHKYCITKEIFNADLIISLPKIKTHQKTGITGALKNIVGINGDKDFLPHHRIGGVGFGGDCYPGKNYFRYAAEILLDAANRKQGKRQFWIWQKTAAFLWKASLPGRYHNISGGWYGNDTSWRMVLDLNKIVIYGRADGSIGKDSQRKIYSLCDGIIAGQGDGPLKPEPLPLGMIGFTNSSQLVDICFAHLMKLEPEKIPILLNSKLALNSNENSILLNGISIQMEELDKYSLETKLPPGWDNYIKYNI